MTAEHLRRTIQAIIETDALIAKERSYRPDLQKADYLASLEQHAERLAKKISDHEAGR